MKTLVGCSVENYTAALNELLGVEAEPVVEAEPIEAEEEWNE
jgi:hypothetical protein